MVCKKAQKYGDAFSKSISMYVQYLDSSTIIFSSNRNKLYTYASVKEYFKIQQMVYYIIHIAQLTIETILYHYLRYIMIYFEATAIRFLLETFDIKRIA